MDFQEVVLVVGRKMSTNKALDLLFARLTGYAIDFFIMAFLGAFAFDWLLDALLGQDIPFFGDFFISCFLNRYCIGMFILVWTLVSFGALSIPILG